MDEESNVITVTRSDAPRAVDVLCAAFRDYSAMRYFIGAAGAEYDRRLRRLIEFFVTARMLRGETAIGAEGDGVLGAVALVSDPEGESPVELGAMREALWAELGPEARGRYEGCGRVWEPLHVTVPHIHLNMIGVHPSHQGKGLGRALLDHVHAMSRRTPGSQGVTLTTEDPGNVPLYEHMGYEVVGQARIAPELETWVMFRRDAG